MIKVTFVEILKHENTFNRCNRICRETPPSGSY